MRLLRLLVAGAGLSCLLSGQLTLDFMRYKSYGPERVFAGHPVIYELLHASWSFDATCSGTTCTSAGYLPAGDEILVPDDWVTPPAGMQNARLYGGWPKYRPVNIETNGNGPNTWSLAQCACTAVGGYCTQTASFTTTAGHSQTCGVFNNFGGASTSFTPQIVNLASAATIHFYVSTGGPPLTAVFHGAFNWPANTTMTYFYPTTVPRNCMFTVTPVAIGNNFLYSPGYITCVRVSIPASTTPQVYSGVGWEVCTDTTYTSCKRLEFDISVEAPPTMEQTPPAVIPPLDSSYDQPTNCQNNSGGSAVAGTDCSFKNITSGPRSDVPNHQYEHGLDWWCNSTSAYGNPDSGLELATPPRYLDFVAAPNNQTSTFTTPGFVGFFYDGARVYYGMARWWNNPAFENCARAIASRYADQGPGVSGAQITYFAKYGLIGPGLGNYNCLSTNSSCMLSVHGGNDVWNAIPKGIEMGLSRWNGGQYSDTWVPSKWQATMNQELFNTMWWLYGYTAGTGFGINGGYYSFDLRSNGYPVNVTQSYLNTGAAMYKTTGASGNRVTSYTPAGQTYWYQAESELSSYMLITQSDTTRTATNRNIGRVGVQPYMAMSSAADSMVEYWERTHDPAVPKVIGDFLTFIQPYYDTVNHAMPGITTGTGPWCGGLLAEVPAASLWYQDQSTVTVGGCLTSYYTNLSGMYAWLFAWYWRHWGNDSFRATADEMFKFSYIMPVSQLRDSAKNNYENGRHWIQFLRYRMGY